MNEMQDLFSYNFQETINSLENRIPKIKNRKLNDLHVIFNDIDDGLYAYLMYVPFSGYPNIRSVIPGWASDEIRQDSTGEFSLQEHIEDATWFWRTVRDRFTRITGKSIATARVADYGGGWGRVARFANKNVPAEQFFVLEPNPVFRDIYKDCRLPGNLIEIDWLSSENTGLTKIDLIFSYSILTHSSDRLTRNIVDRWAEMTVPGSVVAFTVRPGCYLNGAGGDMSVFTDTERPGLTKVYDSGKLVYKPYPGDEHWGVTIAPEKYLSEVFAGRFSIVDRAFQIQTMNQLIMFAQRT